MAACLHLFVQRAGPAPELVELRHDVARLADVTEKRKGSLLCGLIGAYCGVLNVDVRYTRADRATPIDAQERGLEGKPAHPRHHPRCCISWQVIGIEERTTVVHIP